MDYCVILMIIVCFIVIALAYCLSADEDKIEKLKTESGYTKDELEAKTKGFNELSENLSAKQKEADELQSKIEDCEGKLTEKDDKIQSLEHELVEVKNDLRDKIENLTDAENKLEEIKVCADRLESKNSEMMSLAETKEAEFKKEIDKANEVIKSISEKAGSLYKLHTEIEELHRGVKTRQADVKRLADETAIKEKEINELNSKIDSKSLEFENIYSEMK